MKIFWFSFSYEGVNRGVCIVQADCNDSALEKTKNLGIQPKWDDIACYELDSLDEEENMEYNRLYSREDMQQLGYNPTSQIK